MLSWRFVKQCCNIVWRGLLTTKIKLDISIRHGEFGMRFKSMAEYAPLSPRTSGITRRTSDDNGPPGRRAYTRILGLGVLCLISLCRWILAFWVSLNPNSITLNLELPTTETTGGLITESSNAGLSISEILDGSWKPKPHSLQWAGISEVLLVDRERDTNRVSAWQVKDDRDSLAWREPRLYLSLTGIRRLLD